MVLIHEYIEIGIHDTGDMVLIKNRKQDTGYTEDTKSGIWDKLTRETSNFLTWDNFT